MNDNYINYKKEGIEQRGRYFVKYQVLSHDSSEFYKMYPLGFPIKKCNEYIISVAKEYDDDYYTVIYTIGPNELKNTLEDLINNTIRLYRNI